MDRLRHLDPPRLRTARVPIHALVKSHGRPHPTVRQRQVRRLDPRPGRRAFRRVRRFVQGQSAQTSQGGQGLDAQAGLYGGIGQYANDAR